MKKLLGKKLLCLYLTIFGLILASILGIYVYCRAESQSMRTYTFTSGNLDTPQSGLYLYMNVSKQWHDLELRPDIPIGGQYDFGLRNDGKWAFHDWTAQLEFSNGVTLDSYWNGSFSSKDNTIRFVAHGVPAYVKPHNGTTFGAVIYAKQIVSLKSYTITGYKDYNIFSVPLFWILVVAFALCSLCFLVSLITHIHTRKFMLQQQQDSEIIKQTIGTFTNFIDAKDPYTSGHSSRVAAYSCELARRMKLQPAYITRLGYIALMHDCGKMGIPDSVLMKPGKLTPEEYKQIQAHTTMGNMILRNFTTIPQIRDGAHYHHERYDGTGYPLKLKGEAIPLCARIIGIADAYDAMSSTRCYRKKLSEEQIRHELTSNAGKQFDPAIVPLMLQMMDDGFVQTVQEKFPCYDSERRALDALAQ